METLRGEEAVEAAADRTVVARSRELEAVDHSSFYATVDPPSVVWRGPTETIATTGATASLTADGPDRFERIRETATALFADLEDAVPRAARPRLFGGFTFHDGAGNGDGDTEIWHGFPDAWFVLPGVQVTTRDGRAWLTVTATGADAEETAAERLEEWA